MAVLALVVATLAIAPHLRVLAGQTWDDVDYHVRVAPPRLAAAAQVHAGQLPRWWEGSSWGVPLYAEASHGAADPVQWIAASPHGLDLLFLLHVPWLALGVLLWARRAGASAIAAATAALLAATTGLVTSAALRGALPGLADLPWIGWAALGLAHAEARRTRWIYASLIALLVGAIALAGEFALVLDAAAIAIVLGARRETAGWLAAALGAGAAIACLLWIPALSLHGAGAQVHGIGLARLVELVVPGAFGSIDPAYGVPAFHGRLATSDWPSLFVGASLVGLALAYRSDARSRGLTIGFGLAALIVGRGGWPAGLGAPEVHAGAFVLVLAVRAARGVDGLVAGERRARVALGIAAAACAVATWCMVALRDPDVPAIDRALVDGGIGVACMIAAVVLARGKSLRLRYAAVALALAPSVVAMRSTERTTSSSLVDEQPRWVTDGLAMVRTPPRRLYRPPGLANIPDKPGTSPMIDASLAGAIATLDGTSAARWGIASARSDDPARLPEEAAAWASASHGGGTLLERFGIGLAVLPRSVVEGGKTPMPELDRVDDWALAQYPSAPPAVTVSDWEWAADTQSAFKTVFPADGSRGVPLDRGVLIGTGPTPDTGGIHHATTCDIARWEPGAIDLTCKTPSNAYAIASSSAIAGWTVDVDGVPTPWVAADVLRRAVYLEAGKHEVQWRYHVPGLPAGLVLAALGIALLAGLGWRAWR